MMRRTQTLVTLGRKYVTAVRFPISARVGYGTIIPASARIFSPWPIAKVQEGLGGKARFYYGRIPVLGLYKT